MASTLHHRDHRDRAGVATPGAGGEDGREALDQTRLAAPEIADEEQNVGPLTECPSLQLVESRRLSLPRQARLEIDRVPRPVLSGVDRDDLTQVGGEGLTS